MLCAPTVEDVAADDPLPLPAGRRSPRPRRRDVADFLVRADGVDAGPGVVRRPRQPGPHRPGPRAGPRRRHPRDATGVVVDPGAADLARRLHARRHRPRRHRQGRGRGDHDRARRAREGGPRRGLRRGRAWPSAARVRPGPRDDGEVPEDAGQATPPRRGRPRPDGPGLGLPRRARPPAGAPGELVNEERRGRGRASWPPAPAPSRTCAGSADLRGPRADAGVQRARPARPGVDDGRPAGCPTGRAGEAARPRRVLVLAAGRRGALGVRGWRRLLGGGSEPATQRSDEPRTAPPPSPVPTSRPSRRSRRFYDQELDWRAVRRPRVRPARRCRSTTTGRAAAPSSSPCCGCRRRASAARRRSWSTRVARVPRDVVRRRGRQRLRRPDPRPLRHRRLRPARHRASAPVDCLTDERARRLPRRRPQPRRRGRGDARSSALISERGQGCLAETPRWRPTSRPSRPPRTWTCCARRSGEQQLDYLGASYGTKLGATYAELFPEQVGRFVLDGALDVSLTLARAEPRPGRGLRDRAARLRRELRRDRDPASSATPSTKG